jgi:RNA polymerase-binding transcription factor DksA
MKRVDEKKLPCAACGQPIGNATIVAGGEFPQARLCAACNSKYTFEEIVIMIRSRAT